MKSTTTQAWNGPDSTIAPRINDTDQEGNYPNQWPGFAEKFLRGQIIISRQAIFFFLTLLFFGVLSWLYIQDNQIGRLDEPAGIKWFFIKSSFYFIINFFASIVIFISSIKWKRGK